MTIKEIEDEIQRLQSSLDKMERQDIAEFKERAKENVGRCFIVGGEYVKVIGIPREQLTKTGRLTINRYQYPALYLGYSEHEHVIPFRYGTLFSGIWGDGTMLLDRDVREISNAEFMKEFRRTMQMFKQRIDKADTEE